MLSNADQHVFTARRVFDDLILLSAEGQVDALALSRLTAQT